MTFDGMWSAIEPIGRDARTGGYRRYAWTQADAALGEWFAGEADTRGLDLVTDRGGNQWAWWGDPDAAVAAGRPGVVLGSHLDSVPDGGAFDGPLGVVSAFAVLDALRGRDLTPSRPIAVARFVDEEGARFGIACAGSRLVTGSLDADKARGLRDVDGVTMAEAMTAAGHPAEHVGRDHETLRRVGTFVELHIEQGRALVDVGAPVAIGSVIWPHGRWRIELNGEANHAGTTRLEDRSDPMLGLATTVLTARMAAKTHGCVATVGKLQVEPNGVNAIPSRVTAWLDARGPDEAAVRAVVEAIQAQSCGAQSCAQSGGVHSGGVHFSGEVFPGAHPVQESWTPETVFDVPLRGRLSTLLGGAPMLATGAGHDAGVLATAGLSTAMLFVRNPTGVSHSPAEFAERDDCHAGVEALTAVTAELAR